MKNDNSKFLIASVGLFKKDVNILRIREYLKNNIRIETRREEILDQSLEKARMH